MFLIVIAELRNLKTVLEFLFIFVSVVCDTFTHGALKFDEIVL